MIINNLLIMITTVIMIMLTISAPARSGVRSRGLRRRGSTEVDGQYVASIYISLSLSLCTCIYIYIYIYVYIYIYIYVTSDPQLRPGAPCDELHVSPGGPQQPPDHAEGPVLQ